MEDKIFKEAKLALDSDDFNKAIQLYSKIYQESENSYIAIKIGDIYFSKALYNEALKWFKKAEQTEDDSIETFYYLAKTYFAKKQYKKASEYYSIYYMDKPPLEKMKIGDLFFDKKIFDEAEYWYQEARIGGGTEALLKLCNTYFNSDQYNLGAAICEPLLKKCNTETKYVIAKMYYETGKFDEAIAVYKKMSDEGSIEGTRKHADTCFKLEKFDAALESYRKCMENNDTAEIKARMGDCYYYIFGEDNTFENCVYWYEYALDQGNTEGLYKLGLCYQYGKGIEIDIKKAINYYTLAAENGDSDAICKLGNCHKKGIGFVQDDKIAVDYYLKAAEDKNNKAQFNLGLCYLRGEGVEINKSTAKYWLSLSRLAYNDENDMVYDEIANFGENIKNDSYKK